MVIIRPISETFLVKGFRETFENLRSLGNMSTDDLVAILKKICKNPNHFIFVALEDHNVVVGSITLIVEQKFIHDGGLVGHIEDVVVRRGFERRGIDRQLVAEAVDCARTSGCYKVIFDCDRSHVALYEKYGFREHEIEMRMDLL